MRRLSRSLSLALITLCVFLIVLVRVPSGLAVARSSAGLHRVPPAAQALAGRLHLRSAPVVGDQAIGSGRPWTVWLPRTVPPGSVGPGRVPRSYLYASGPALFSSPRGARGKFHYFDSSPLSRFGGDAYRGPAMTRTRAVRIAFHWLQVAGAPISHARMHVSVGSGTTNIGGTGLCCFKSLAIVHWGSEWSSGSLSTEPRYDVYVADAGTVVQVDMGAPAAEGAETLAHPCSGARRDRHGVALGAWCFSYPDAVGGIIFSEVSFHDGWVHDPDMLAALPLARVHGRFGPLRRITLTSARAVYQRSVGATTYQVTLVPAFPGLVGSTWETARVQVVRSAQ